MTLSIQCLHPLLPLLFADYIVLFYFFLLLSPCYSSQDEHDAEYFLDILKKPLPLNLAFSTQGPLSQCFIPFLSTALGNLLCHQLLCLSLGLFSLSSYQMLLQVMFTRLWTATSSQPSDKYNFICHNEAWTSWLTFGARSFVSEMISFNFEKAWWWFFSVGCRKLILYLTHADVPLNNSCVFCNVLWRWTPRKVHLSLFFNSMTHVDSQMLQIPALELDYNQPGLILKLRGWRRYMSQQDQASNHVLPIIQQETSRQASFSLHFSFTVRETTSALLY